MLLQKKNSHKLDERIVFDEEPHIYYIDDSSEGIISVTTLIHTHFPHFDSSKVIDNMMKSKKWKDSKYYGKTKKQIQDGWKEKGRVASEAGTIMHQDIEYYFNKEKVSNNSPEFHQFLDFNDKIVKKEKLIPFRTEWEVFDEDHKIAGSIDMLFKKEGEEGLYIYDWKRSKKINKNNQYENGYPPLDHLPNSNFWHYSLQLNIYKYILEENYNQKILGMYLACFHPERKTYQRICVADLSDEVKSIFSLRKNLF